MVQPSSQLDDLVEHIHATIGDNYIAWPGGWPNQAGMALLDAIFSIRARYGSPSTGVRLVVTNWRNHRGESPDDLRLLGRQDPDELLGILDKDSVISGRRKAAVVIDAGKALTEVGPMHTSDP